MKFRAHIRLQREIKSIGVWSHLDLKVNWMPFVETREEARTDIIRICMKRYPGWGIESIDVFEYKEKF